MIPLGDSIGGGRRRPVATIALIVANALVFVYELTLRGAALDEFVQRWGAVPRLVLPALAWGAPSHAALFTLLTSQFVHAGVLHLGGNMLFLWVFGRAVEDRLGSPLYLGFYLLVGCVAGLVQCVVSPGDPEPLIGASGAIAGVLGLYFVSYPTAWTRVLVPILFFFWTFDLPAVLVLAFWFASQFFVGVAAITHATRATSGDIAVWAHVAGFVLGAGVAFGLSLRASPGSRPAQAVRTRVGAGVGEHAPGPARLVASVADLAALLLAARLVVSFFGLVAPRSPVASYAAPIVSVTQPVVAPLQGFLPTLRVMGGALETYTLVAMLGVYVLAGLVGQVFVRK
ncbi:MAG: rhomboid family intramembrane serine protease [Chloroflexi bacterium]|nr:rhomboid family intramembrane serine protease [Chloroflexota bacterium]MBV9595615.1 rhomboid family intramembrane serine protease [Chloroflexota bacterium]